MRRKHHRRHQGRFTRLASLARSLTAPPAARLLLVFATLLVITPAQGNAQSATYQVTFTGKFTGDALASGVSVPPGEHFTTLIGAVHNDSVTFWSSGGTATAGIESMAEDGGTTTLKSEINAAMLNALAVIEQSIASGGTATATVEITLTTGHPLVTLTSMVAPSPDWFVGVSGLSLLDAQNEWLASHTVGLFPYDAGTEDGTEFSLNNNASDPQGTITSIKGMGKFSNEPIATLTFTRQSVNTAPSFTSDTSFEMDENQTMAGTVAAEDPDSGDGISYEITGGTDALKFNVGETTGGLTFKVPPNYERAADAASTDPLNDAGNNEYVVTVTATGGTADRALTAEQTIAVSVRNVEEAGTVSFSQVGAAIRAKLGDPDGGVNSRSWQWARSSDRSTGWTNIDGTTSASYTPSSDDDEMYLRATVSYNDGHGSGKQAQGVSTYEIIPPKLLVSTLVSGLTIPWDLAFTPGGTMLFTQRGGVLSSRLADGTVQNVTAELGDLFAKGETGLMGIVVDPDFTSNRRFYTCQGHTGPEVQVIAWTIDAAHTTATRVTDPLVGGIPATSGRHGGCRLRFGPQGYLWIATGDTASGTVPQDLTSLGGKILRVDSSTGAGAPANPFTSSPRIYTYGHRNPQGLALRPGTSQMWSVEHGPSVDDEINLLVAGRNYGWDPVPGYNESVSMTDLVKFPGALEAKWSSGSPTLATSGSIFLEGDQWGVWEGRLAVATLKDKKLRLFEFTPGGELVSQVIVPELDGTYSRLRTPMLGPDGGLYVTTSNGGGNDRILKIVKDDAVPVTLKLTPEAIGETGGVSTVTASLERVSNAVTTVMVSAEAVAPAAAGYFTLSANRTLTIAAGGTSSSGAVAVGAVDNNVDAPDKMVTVSATAENINGVTPPSAVTLTIIDDDATPMITTASPILVAENETEVATLAATDADDRMENLEWEITAGLDRNAFTLTAAGGLAFASAKDFENPDDANGDGDYEVTVRVSDGANLAEAGFTVRLQDVDDTAPMLLSAVVNGTTLTLTYDEPLDGSSGPVPEDFTVDGGDQTRTVTQVVVSGKAVELTLDVGAGHLEAGIQVSYTPGANPIRDVPGNEAEALSRESVTNETPDTTPPEVSSLAITSNPGLGQTYAAGDEIEVTVIFDETVEVEGTPQLRLRVGTRDRMADYNSGTGTAALVFGYEVADGDEDTDGVSIEAGRIALNGGTIEDEADNDAVLDHEAVAPQAGHQVDGVRPAFVSAAVEEASLALTYGEALDPGSRPAPGAFTVEVDGSGRSISGVSVSGSVVTLTLDPAVEQGDTGIRVSYSPGTNPIRDAVGNEAEGLSNRTVTNATGAPNTAPEITSVGPFDVPENQAIVRRLVARDTDPGDEVTGWEIAGGADQGQFTITSDTGDLSFRTAPDFEAPGDNEYEVTVKVRSGAGTRELEAEQTFTVRVTDEPERPEVPEAPTFSQETAGSLTVHWSEPENTGPPIMDYDAQYREQGTGRFIDAQHEGPGLSLTLDDLTLGTAYEVQVRATNDEGTSDWSEPGEGMTVTPLTAGMTSGIEPPVEGPFTVRFIFSEPVTGFTRGAIATRQEPPCADSANNPVSCNLTIAAFETTDDRIFTTAVTPRTDQVAHNYTLTLTVPEGRVTSAVDNKPNEAAALQVRIAPPGVTVPISSLSRTANSGNGRVTLRWNAPTNTGGAPIVRYEYRWMESGGEFSGWIRVAPAERSATVRNLTNGREYVLEVRGVNALGYGGVETVRATPSPSTGGGGFGGGGGGSPGGGGPRQTVPSAPRNLLADGGDGQVTLSWQALEDDGGLAITDYEYRIDGRGSWISIGSTRTIHTVTGLANGTAYAFQVRAVNAAGNSAPSNRAEATPGAGALDFAHFANGADIISSLVLMNVATHPIRPVLYFYDQEGHPIAAESVVDLTEDLEVTEGGALSIRTKMEPLGELTISTHGRGEVVSGSVKVISNGPIGGVLRFGLPGIGVAGVGASLPLRDSIFPARRQAGGLATAAAIRNPGEEAMVVSCRLMSGGIVLEEVEITLQANGQEARYIDGLFTGTDTSGFVGSVRCTAEGLFTGIAVELDAGNRIFTTLPVVPVARTGGGGQEAGLDFAHFANGSGIISELVLVNRSTQPSGPPLSPFHQAVPPSRPALYFYDKEGHPIAAESVVDLTGDLEITEDGALTVQTEMEPLGELTISTHGRGDLVSGSVKVVSEGPIGGVLRFDLPGIGVAGVGASLPLRDAIFPARRQAGGITTAAAIHNPGEEAMVVSCRLMQGGAVLEEVEIDLGANGQDARYIEQIFTGTDTSGFVGSVRCTAPPGEGMFTGVAVELDASNRIFTTLPVVPVQR